MKCVGTVLVYVLLTVLGAGVYRVQASAYYSSDFKAQIRFSGYAGEETLTNFPALITLGTNIQGFSYSQFAAPVTGGDLRFFNSNGTVELNYEIEKWDTNITATVSPTNIPGCMMWLKADAGVQKDGSGYVSGWLDQSGSNNNLSQLTGSGQPLYVDSVLNGQPVIRFDGTDDRMTNSNASGVFDLTNVSVFVVLAPRFAAPAYNPGYFGVRGAGGSRMSMHITSARTQWQGWNQMGGSSCNHTFVQNEFLTLGAVWSGLNEAVYANGVAIGASTNYPWNAAIVNQTMNLGSSSSGEYMQADIAEVVVYDRALTLGEQAQLELYLARRYGFSVSQYAPERTYAWVKVPELTSNNCIWACWGNPGGTNSPAYTTNGAAWSAGYAGVWHLKEAVTDEVTIGVYADSSSNRNVGVQNNTESRIGLIGSCAWFDGDDYISVTNEAAYDFNDQVTVSAWVRVDGGWNTVWQMFVTKGSDQNWDLRRFVATEQISFCLNNSNTVGAVTNMADGSWHHLTGVYRQSPLDARVYLDGQLYYVDPAPPPVLTQNNEPLRFGGRNAGGYNHRGMIDEVEVSRAYRSSNWVTAVYINQMPNSTFIDYGDVEMIAKGMVIMLK